MFGDYIRGEAKYEEAATGQRVKVQDGYRHVYQDNQGSTLSTNVPLDAGHVNWELPYSLSMGKGKPK